MKLRYYQSEAVQAVFDYFSNGGKGNPLIACPTGTGKSLIIAELIKRILFYWPGQRILVLTHVKELLVQDSDKLKAMWPNAPFGIFSAGLGQSNSSLPIIFGGIASVNSNPELFGHRDLVMVDEAHLISTNEGSMYQKVIAKLKEINPALKVIGLTATAYRIGQGMITDGGLFTDIVYDATSLSAFNRLIAEGFIAPLIPKRTNTGLDVSQVKISNGDFNKHDLQSAIDIDEITYSAIKELVECCHERNCGLVFATGKDHCEHVTTAIQSFGETATFIHSGLPTKERDSRLSDFKLGVYKYIVSNGILTTGFDHPPVDIIGVLRPTMSTALWVQLLGRGTRPYTWLNEQQYIKGYNYVKNNCLVLDFAKNTPRLGPINDPVKPRKKGQKTGDAPIRICSQCGVYNHASARQCCECGFEFEMQSKIFGEAGSEELIKSDVPQIENIKVMRVIYNRHIKPGSPPMIQASYYTGAKTFQEFVCFEHGQRPRARAVDWWRQRSQEAPPLTTDEALARIGNLRQPVSIRVHVNKHPYPEVISYDY